MTTQADETPLLFDAVLQPHRSLSPTGFYVLMAGVLVARPSGLYDARA